ncbi:hypothetical protein LINPERHAP1_LOCUS11686 [Linum perenne]
MQDTGRLCLKWISELRASSSLAMEVGVINIPEKSAASTSSSGETGVSTCVTSIVKKIVMLTRQPWLRP